MSLQLFHPEIATRPCSQCLEWWYDDFQEPEGKKWKFQNKIQERRGHKFKRPPHVQPPCRAVTPSPCPKGCPEREHESVLSDKNRQAVEFYKRTKAMYGKNLTDEMASDEVLQRNMAVINDLMKAHEISAGVR